MFVSSDGGENYSIINVPLPANGLNAPVLSIHPHLDTHLLWTGETGCEGSIGQCHTETWYSTDTGASWSILDSHTVNCQWGLVWIVTLIIQTDKFVAPDPLSIFCQSHVNRDGVAMGDNDAQLKASKDFGKTWTEIQNNVFGFATFEEFMVVAVVCCSFNTTTVKEQRQRNGLVYLKRW